MSFTKMEKNVLNISALPDKVQNQAQSLKATFDQAGVDIKEALNGLINELESKESAGNLGAIKNGATITLQAYLDSLNDGKQDSEEGKGLSTEDFTTILKKKLESIEEGANKYDLPEATNEVLGGIRLGDTLEVVDGKVESKGNPMPDEIARRAIELHEADETIHMTADEKVAIRELQPVSTELAEVAGKTADLVEVAEVSKELLAIVDTGVSGVIEADSLVFDVTVDMVGKRIICTSEFGLRINLPSPVEVGKGAMVEIETSKYVEVYTLNGTIHKGEVISDKCIQPSSTVRRYYSTGDNWVTDFSRVNNSYTLWVNFSSSGSDTEPKVEGRQFKSLSQLKYFREYKNIVAGLSGDVTLDQNINFDDCELSFRDGTLIIPSGYKIQVCDVNLKFENITLKIEGTAFVCAGKVNVILGAYHSVTIRPFSNSSFVLFYTYNTDLYNHSNGCTLLTISLMRVNIGTSNIENYTGKGNIIDTLVDFSKPPIFIEFSGYQAVTKGDNIFWHKNSNTISRIGTSGLYTIG